MSFLHRVPAVALWWIMAFVPAASAQTSNPLIDVQAAGHGEPQLIFIPGLAIPGSVWDQVVARFEGDHRCHVVTLAGFGGKPPVKTEHFLDDMADALIAYIREQKIARPVLVGHSLGGTLAMKIACKAPDLPGRLVIVDSLPFPAGLMGPNINDAAAAQALSDSRSREYFSQTPAEFAADRRSFLADLVSSPEKAAALAEQSARSDPATTGQAIREILAGDLRPSLHRITCPTVVLGAMADKLAKGLPAESIEIVFHQQYRNLPGVRFLFFARARHFIMVDDLDGFTTALRLELTPP